jgi:hypothetical protein
MMPPKPAIPGIFLAKLLLQPQLVELVTVISFAGPTKIHSVYLLHGQMAVCLERSALVVLGRSPPRQG